MWLTPTRENAASSLAREPHARARANAVARLMRRSLVAAVVAQAVPPCPSRARLARYPHVEHRRRDVGEDAVVWRTGRRDGHDERHWV